MITLAWPYYILLYTLNNNLVLNSSLQHVHEDLPIAWSICKGEAFFLDKYIACTKQRTILLKVRLKECLATEGFYSISFTQTEGDIDISASLSTINTNNPTSSWQDIKNKPFLQAEGGERYLYLKLSLNRATKVCYLSNFSLKYFYSTQSPVYPNQESLLIE